MVYLRILNIVPCAIQWDCVVYPSSLHQFASSNPRPPVLPSPKPIPFATASLLSVSGGGCFCFMDKLICVIFLDSTQKGHHMTFVFLFPTWYDSLQVRPCCYRWHCFILHYG